MRTHFEKSVTLNSDLIFYKILQRKKKKES